MTDYYCPACGKKYKQVKWFKQHLINKHSYDEVSMNSVDRFLARSLFTFDSFEHWKRMMGD